MVRPMQLLLIAVVSMLTLSRTQRVATRLGSTTYLDSMASRAYVDFRFQTYHNNSSLSPFVAPLNLTSQRVVNVADPVDAQDAATKNYVDSQLLMNHNSSSLSPFVAPLNLTSQRIVNVADPVDAQDAATKNYVDAGRGVLRAQIYTNATNDVAKRIPFPTGKNITNGKIAVVGLWIGQIDSRFTPPNNFAWIDAYTYRGTVTDLIMSVESSSLVLTVGGFPNPSGDVLVHYLEYP